MQAFTILLIIPYTQSFGDGECRDFYLRLNNFFKYHCSLDSVTAAKTFATTVSSSDCV